MSEYEQREERQMWDATCSVCDVEFQVPFKPDADRKVFCREHYQRPNTNRGGGGGNYGNRSSDSNFQKKRY